MIKVNELTKQWGNFILSDINFELPKGYICGLIGENGAGKTTLLNLLLGLYYPDSGDIFINNLNMAKNEAKIKDDLGYVLQIDLFDPYLSLADNADSYGKYYSRYDKTLFLDYCGRFELNSRSRLKTLSKGQQLKFQFAFALSHKPVVLILDEPTANFDPSFRNQFFDILTNFISDGEHTVLLATHLTSDLERIGDYITFIHRGKLVFSQDRESLESSYRLLTGEHYKLKLLPKDKVIYLDKKEHSSTALVKHSKFASYDPELNVAIPTIEEIMYHYIKEDNYV